MYNYAVAIIFYNPDNNAVKRIKNYKSIFSSILIIDNTEQPDTKIIDSVKNIDKVIYHSMKRNAGMSVALNYAFHWSIKNNIDFLLTMDQDTDYPPLSINKMIHVIENTQRNTVAIFGSNFRKVYISKHGNEVYGPWKMKEHERKPSLNSMTSGSFYDVKIISKYLPLPDLFIGMVDNDLAYTLFSQGYEIRIIGCSKISQRVGSPVRNTLINRIFHKVILSPQRYYYSGRNINYLINKFKNNKSILRELKIGKLRLLFNLYICEENKLAKIIMWNKGLKEQI